jgi:hypothetical protein
MRPETFIAHQYIQMNPRPITKVVIDTEGILIERKRFASLFGKTYSEYHRWNGIAKIELHYKTNTLNARRLGYYNGSQKQLYMHTRTGIIRLDLINGGPFKNSVLLLKRVRESYKKNIIEVHYTSLINKHFIAFALILGCVIIAPFILPTHTSMQPMAAIIQFALVLALVLIFCVRYKKR